MKTAHEATALDLMTVVDPDMHVSQPLTTRYYQCVYYIWFSIFPTCTTRLITTPTIHSLRVHSLPSAGSLSARHCSHYIVPYKH